MHGVYETMRLQFATSCFEFILIAIALAPLPRRCINLFSGQRSVPPAFLKLWKVSSFLFSPAAKIDHVWVGGEHLKTLFVICFGRPCLGEDWGVFVACFVVCAGCKERFPIGEKHVGFDYLSFFLFLLSQRVGVDGQFNLVGTREKNNGTFPLWFFRGVLKLKNQKLPISGFLHIDS